MTTDFIILREFKGNILKERDQILSADGDPEEGAIKPAEV